MGTKSKKHPKTVGKLMTALVEAKITTLVLGYILGLCGAILFFSISYWVGGYIVNDSGVPQNFWACLYFSAVTQSTLGYGDLIPINYGRFFATFQTTMSGLYSVLFLGIVVAKTLWPPESIVIADIALFDYYESKFRFRFYNAHKLPLCDTKYTLSLRGVGNSNDLLLHRNFKIEIEYEGHPIIDPQRAWLVNTKPCKDVPRETLSAAKTNILFPGHLNDKSILVLQIQGHYPKIGGQLCYSIKKIPAANIRCGKLKVVEEIDSAGNPLNLDWNNFEKYDPVKMSLCKKCSKNGDCFLAKRVYS